MATKSKKKSGLSQKRGIEAEPEGRRLRARQDSGPEPQQVHARSTQTKRSKTLAAQPSTSARAPACPKAPSTRVQKAVAPQIAPKPVKSSKAGKRRVTAVVPTTDDEDNEEPTQHRVLGTVYASGDEGSPSEEDEEENEEDEEVDEFEGLDKETLVAESVSFDIEDDDENDRDPEEMGEEEHGNAEGANSVKEQAANKGKSKRARERQNEVPQIGTPKRKSAHVNMLSNKSPVFIDDDEEDIDDEDPDDPVEDDALPIAKSEHARSSSQDKHWPKRIWIVPQTRENQRYPGLLDQRPAVRGVVGAGIDAIIEHTLYVFPFISVEFAYRGPRKILVDVSADLDAETPDTGYAEVGERVAADPAYGCCLARMTTQRVSNLRGNWKKTALSKVEAAFGLFGLTVSQIKNIVTRELEGFKFVYPRNASDAIIRTQPFMHPCIILLLNDSVFTKHGRQRQSIAQKYEDRFRTVEFVKDGTTIKRKAIPDSMVCFAATVIQAALDDWKNGYRVATAFNADEYQDTYKNMLEILDTIRHARNGAAYDALMVRIYAECSKGTPSANTANLEQAVASLDIENMPIDITAFEGGGMEDGGDMEGP